MASWYKMRDFEKTFSVGDIITFSRGMPVVITAIGIERFLFRRLGEFNGERVKTVCSCGPEIPFRFWNPKMWPDSQYEYALEREKSVTQVESEIQTKSHLNVGKV